MRVLHFSTTPLVGAPGRICRALREATQVDARWVVLRPEVGAYARMRFDLDWTWEANRDEVVQFAESADVWHLHNFLDTESQEFAPLDFGTRWKSGHPTVRHFHSTPDFIRRTMPDGARRLSECPLPRLVIAQHPERFMPEARLVPNVVFPGEAQVNLPVSRIRIGYAPSRFNSGRTERWDTKAYPETVRLLRRVQRTLARRGQPIDIDVIEGVSHEECLKRKQQCQIVIDDLATGSYHLNTLESLADGAVCLTYLDRRTQTALHALTGRNDFPAISVGLEDAAEVLLELCDRPALLQDLGASGRRWMEAYWSVECSSAHFTEAYRMLIANPLHPWPARFEATELINWAAIELHDALWRSRQRRWPQVTPPWALAAKSRLGRIARALGLRR